MGWDKWRKFFRCLLIVAGLLLLVYEIQGQNLENLGEKPPLEVSGGFNFMTTGYAVGGISARRDPFTWIASGNLNLDLYGWSIPLAFSYTNHQGRFQQPFNRYGISPQYKWIKTYLGYHSLTYSSYTLNGHTFLGGGIELTPGNFRVHAMYGRLRKAVEIDTLSGQSQPLVFARKGMATKVGYETPQGSISTIIFYAKDDPNSLVTFSDSSLVFPAQNIALSLIAKKQMGKHLSWEGEWASSLLTRDIQSSPIPEDSLESSWSAWLIPIRQSTTQHQAWKTSLSLAMSKGFIQWQYERVDPDYQTLGAYFFNNDLENMTLGINWQFWQNRLSVNFQGGLQHNNLDQSEITQTSRWVSNYSINIRPADRWQLNTTYSNFTSFTNIRPQSDPFFTTEFDSLNFYQINQNASLSSSYTFGNKERKHALSMSSTYQQANDVIPKQLPGEQISYYYSNNMAYRISIIPTDLGLSLGGNFHYSVLQEINTTTVGPLLSISKGFLEKKLRSSISTSYNRVLQNMIASSQVLTARMSGSYSYQKNHRFSLNLNLLNNFPTGEKEAFTEFTATARYGYTF